MEPDNLEKEFRKLIEDDFADQLEAEWLSCLEAAVPQISLQLESNIKECLGRHAAGGERQAGAEGRAWEEVESLSRLRSLVGGRFVNLKQKWLQAGLPLKAHRGEKAKLGRLDKGAWLELSNWIIKQGFEVRLAPDDSECFFEIRKKS